MPIGDVATVAKRVRAAYDEWAHVTSVWDDVVGQPTAIAQLDSGRGGAGARLPPARSGRLDQAPGRPGLRRLARRRRRRSRRPGRPPGAERRAPRRPRGRAGRTGDLRRPGSRDRPADLAGTGRGRAQGHRPARLPPADRRGGGAAAEVDRGAAAVDDVPRARRLRATRAGDDRVSLRADRLPRHLRRGDGGSAGRRRRPRRGDRGDHRGSGRRPVPRPHPGGRSRRSSPVARRSPACPRASTAPADPWSSPSTSCWH